MKIRTKFTLSVVGVLIGLGIVSVMLNLYFVERYYLYEQKKVLNAVEQAFMEVIASSGQPNSKEIEAIENRFGVMMVSAPFSGDVDKLNSSLIDSFASKKLKLSKFWLTEDSLKRLSSQSINRLYDQGASPYKVLVKFIEVKSGTSEQVIIYGIGLPLPQMGQTIAMINQFNLILMALAMLVMVGLIYLISGRLTAPLEALQVLASDISNLNFRQISNPSQDEVGALSVSINNMSMALETAHKTIGQQNEQLKQLMADVSHELKTPLALVKAYQQGILDGLDDGSYNQTISEQIEKMNELVEKLLFWASLEQGQLKMTTVNVQNLIGEVVQNYRILLEQQNIQLVTQFEDALNFQIQADEQGMRTVIDNLISNAIKYTANGRVFLLLSPDLEHNGYMLKVKNAVSGAQHLDVNKLWQPFYVKESSRSKALSGTGLGLPIVKSILDQHHFSYSVEMEKDEIIFSVTLV